MKHTPHLVALTAALLGVTIAVPIRKQSTTAETQSTECYNQLQMAPGLDGAYGLAWGFDVIRMATKTSPGPLVKCDVSATRRFAGIAGDDRNYSVPTWVSAATLNGYSAATAFTSTSTRYSYSDSWGIDIGATADIPTPYGTVSPSGSIGFGGTSSGYSTSSKVTFKSTRYKQLYSLSVNEPEISDSQLSDNFLIELRKAIAGNTPSQWTPFFERYGTHYVKKVTVGGSYSFLGEVSNSGTGSHDTSTLSASLSVGFKSVEGVNGSASVAGTSSSDSLSSKGYMSAQVSMDCTGGTTAICPTDFNAWLASVNDHPEVVKGKLPDGSSPMALGPIHELVSSLSADEVATVSTAIQAHLSELNGRCEAAGVDQTVDQYEYNVGTGNWGGTCRCASGQEYQVGDTGGCINGTFTHDFQKDNGPWSGNRVTCGQVETQPCGGSARGYCDPYARGGATCACRDGFTGDKCQYKQVGWGDSVDGQPAKQGQVYAIGEEGRGNGKKLIAACSAPGVSDGDVIDAAYSNKAGAWNRYEINGYCPDRPDLSVAEGLRVQTFFLHRWWSDSPGIYDQSYGFDRSMYDQQCNGAGHGCVWNGDVKATAPVHSQRMSRFCGAKVTIMPGWSC